MTFKWNFDINTYYENGTINKKDADKLKELLKLNNLPYAFEELNGVVLTFCRGNVRSAVQFLKIELAMKKSIPEVFNNRSLNNEILINYWKSCKLVCTPQMEDGTVVLILGMAEGSSFMQYQMDLTLKLFCMGFDAACYDKLVTGFRVVMDFQNLNMLYLAKMQFNLIRRMLKFGSEHMLVFIRVIHFINGGGVLRKLYRILEMIASTEVMALIICHDKDMDWSEFYKNHISKEFLPSDYGGDLESCDVLQEKLWNIMKNMADYFVIEEENRVLYPYPKYY